MYLLCTGSLLITLVNCIADKREELIVNKADEILFRRILVHYSNVKIVILMYS